jgi:hypothetical protein
VPSFSRALLTILGWTYSNAVGGALALLLPPDSYLRVHYEDVVDDTFAQMDRLAHFLDLPPRPRYEHNGVVVVEVGGHQLHGNRMRHTSTLEVRADDEWEQSLGRRYRALALALTWPWPWRP